MRPNLIFFLVLFLLIPLTSHAAAIHDAAKKGDVAALEATLASGVDVNKSNGLATPLYYAVDGGHLKAATFLISRGADVEAPAIWGPPLIPAASGGKVALVRLLLTNGADPNAQFKTTTALHIASEHGWLDCVKALVEAGANVNALTHVRETPLHLAKINKHEDVATYLLAHGVVMPKPAPILAKLAAADPEKGWEVYRTNCYECHFIERGKGRKIAPNLWGVVGRDKASLPEGGYSEALLAWEGVWTYEDLNTFLWAPKITRPGVFMYYPGVEDETERVNLIAYLRTLNENPIPLPAQ